MQKCSPYRNIPYYTDIGLLPCKRDGGNRRLFDDESANWMQGICCLKGCGASIEDIKEYCRLCLLPESEDTLKARYTIILKQRDKAYERLREAQAIVNYMKNKVRHYEDILSGILPDDTNPHSLDFERFPKNFCGTGKINAFISACNPGDIFFIQIL